MKKLPKTALTLVITTILAGTSLAHDHPTSRGRLVFADHETPVVSLLDLDDFQVTHRFSVPKANPGFSPVAGGRYVVVKTNDDHGTLNILDTGVTRDSHGDHVDLTKGPAKMLGLSFTGDRPAHVISDYGWLVLFYDGQRPWERPSEPKAILVDIATLDGPKPTIQTWKSPAPQHGIAIPVGRGEWIFSVPNPAYAKGDDQKASSRPNGFEVLDQNRQWQTVASFNDLTRPDKSCKLYHGHAALADRHVFGCHAAIADSPLSDGGVLILERDGKGIWGSRKLAYPDARRASTIKATAANPAMVANYGADGRPYDALLRIDPTAASLTAADVFTIPGGQPVCQFELTPDGKRVANLTPDGMLRIYETAPSWTETASFPAVPAFDCAYGAKTPTPTLAIVGNSAFVSDPVNRRIREYHLNTLKQGLDIQIDGMPANIAGGGHGG
ncbi:MAG: hypothetical protein ACOVKO_01050 [Elstera sp.]